MYFSVYVARARALMYIPLFCYGFLFLFFFFAFCLRLLKDSICGIMRMSRTIRGVIVIHVRIHYTRSIRTTATTPSFRCSFFAHYIVYVTMSLRRERVYLYAVYLQTRDNQKRRRFLRAAIIERRRRMTNSEGRQTRPFVKNVVRY